jgi:hypothetical protein
MAMLPKPTWTGGSPASMNLSNSSGSGRSSGRIQAPVCTMSRSVGPSKGPGAGPPPARPGRSARGPPRGRRGAPRRRGHDHDRGPGLPPRRCWCRRSSTSPTGHAGWPCWASARHTTARSRRRHPWRARWRWPCPRRRAHARRRWPRRSAVTEPCGPRGSCSSPDAHRPGEPAARAGTLTRRRASRSARLSLSKSKMPRPAEDCSTSPHVWQIMPMVATARGWRRGAPGSRPGRR